jgi:hypothetical protein
MVPRVTTRVVAVGHPDTAATVFRAEPGDFWSFGATGSGTWTLAEFMRADADTTKAHTFGREPG